MGECLFCKIISGEIPADIVYEDERVVAFKDIDPQAPVHLLIVPRRHIPTLLELTDDDRELIGYIYQKAGELAEKNDIGERGFRLVSNCNEEGGQSVYHIHFHLLGGRNMKWPPG